MRKIYTILILLAAAPALFGATIWQDKNIYSSGVNLQVGNIIVVQVQDISNMRFNVSLDNKKNTTVDSSPDVTITGFLPKVNSTKKISSGDTTRFNGRGRISFTIATRITNQIAGNTYAITGSKTYTFDGISTILTVTGIIDSAMVKGRNISSNDVADFTLELRGVKEGIAIQRPPLGPDDEADAALTEQEKQLIIIDYLQKMLGELTR